MINLTQSQYERLLQRNPEDFHEHIYRFLLETQGDEIRGIPAPYILAMIENGVGRARSHGLTDDGQIMAFVSVMFEIAPNFDEQPRLRAVLADSRMTPSERWDALFADSAVLNDAWEDAARPDFYDHEAWLEAFPADSAER